MSKKYFNLLCAYPKMILAAVIAATLISAGLFSRLPVETSVESLILENDPDLLYYNQFKEIFGEDEFIIAAFSAEDVFTPAILTEIDLLTQEMEDIPEVKEIVSLTNVESILGTEYDFIVRPLCETIPLNIEEAQKIKSLAFNLKSIKDNIVSENGQSSLFLIRTMAHQGDETYDARLVKKIKDLFKENGKEGGVLGAENVHVAGWLVTDVNMSTSINRDNQVFMPLIYGILGLFLFITLRSLLGVVLGLLNITLCLLWTMAGLFLSGGAISPMTAILSPLIMALSVSDGVHFLHYFFQKQRTRENLVDVIGQTICHLWRPCLLTSLTTAIGFLSLLVSDIPPIRQFGLAAAMGMMFEFLLTMTVIPLSLYFLKNTKIVIKDYAIHDNSMVRLVSGLSRFIVQKKFYILMGSFVLVLICAYGTTRIEVETNLIEYFKKSSQVREDFQFIDTRLNGVNTIEISLESIDGSTLLNPDVLEVVDGIETYLENRSFVGTTTSVNTFLKQMHKSFNGENPEFYKIPESADIIAQYMLIYGGDEIYNFINEDYTRTRISARIAEHSSKKLKTYINQIQSVIDEQTQDTGIRAQITGKTFLVNKLVKSIVDSQTESLLIAFVIIFGILFIVFRSVKLGLISLVPNSLPILFNLGIMGLFGIPLNTATAIISAVAIGIAVDDTIHYLTAYQEKRNQGIDRGNAALLAIKEKGEPIIITSLILCFGFGVMIFSSFVPTIQFGFLSAVIMLSAMVCDLFILPAVLLIRGNQKG